MKIKELITLLSALPNQDATIWVQEHTKCYPVEGVGPRWILAEGKEYEAGDDDVRIICEGMPYD